MHPWYSDCMATLMVLGQKQFKGGSGHLGHSGSVVGGPLHSQAQMQAWMQKRSPWTGGTLAAELPSPCEQTCGHNNSRHCVCRFL